MHDPKFNDPFADARRKFGFGEMNDQDDPVVMLLRLRDVRRAAHDWSTFRSGVEPGRIVVPSEVNIRDTRQIPFELDPPEHGAYREVLEAWFRRPLESDYEAKLTELIDRAITRALATEEIEVIEDFALPLQSRALTLLLNVPLSEADTWISWGTHVFRSEDDPLDGAKATVLYDYIDAQINAARKNPGEDIYSALLATQVDGRPLTHEEIKGILILTFAGGRDTVINAITNSVAYFSAHPEALERLRAEPEITGRAVEEFIRYFSPLTHMGRVAAEDTRVCEHAVAADHRISLCWASANRDETVFERPDEVILDRKMNPHVGFGFAHHKCLGATHARQLLKVLLTALARRVRTIEVTAARENLEQWGEFERKVGYHELKVVFGG